MVHQVAEIGSWPMAIFRPGHRALRAGRISLANQIYFVTFATVDRRRLFLSPGIASTCVASLMDERNWREAKLLAWVLMPDHWHGLIELGEAACLSAQVRKLKSCSALMIRQRGMVKCSVWQRGFHDHALRAEEQVIDFARYVVMNPVRAGLVRRVRDYPWWGSIWTGS